MGCNQDQTVCASAAAIYFGTIEPPVDISSAVVLSIVKYKPTESKICTGTAIADRFVLTAKHCDLGEGDSGRVEFGPDPRANFFINVSKVYPHPTTDIMILELESSIKNMIPELQYPVIAEQLTRKIIGQQAVISGYGRREDGETGERRFTQEAIGGFSSQYIQVDGQGKTGACGGDSGGPIFVNQGGVMKLAGGLHEGSSSCVNLDRYTRFDNQKDWIFMITGIGDCGTVTEAGYCEGNELVFCDGRDRLLRVDCEGCGMGCAVASDGAADCIAQE